MARRLAGGAGSDAEQGDDSRRGQAHPRPRQRCARAPFITCPSLFHLSCPVSEVADTRARTTATQAAPRGQQRGGLTLPAIESEQRQGTRALCVPVCHVLSASVGRARAKSDQAPIVHRYTPTDCIFVSCYIIYLTAWPTCKTS